MPRQRSANVSASQCAQPGETSSQPVTGFQVASVHSIGLLSAKVVTRSDLQTYLRARSLAVLVCNPELLNIRCKSPEQMGLLNVLHL